MSKIFAGDLANIRKTVRQQRFNLKESTQYIEGTVEYVARYSRPEEAKRLQSAWKHHTDRLASIQAELKRLQELVESIEDKNKIQYQD